MLLSLILLPKMQTNKIHVLFLGDAIVSVLNTTFLPSIWSDLDKFNLSGLNHIVYIKLAIVHMVASVL